MADNYLEKWFAVYEVRKAALKKGHKRTGTAAKPATNTLPTQHKNNKAGFLKPIEFGFFFTFLDKKNASI